LIGQKKIIDDHKQAILLANAESHRFAIAYHRDKKRKRALQ
jgi:excinuclease UvrABC nuclease subunit